ncbi:FecCD family ABC transporter permease [Luteibacter sp. UNCMF366Tsu5.1]|uniref:FecCD family ABC transporter permease n=1 Tax=Luteibacter sp. UNCMF366Tsu5.1 TaxID=1502758 RepID=UPI000908CA8B|nr:iron ABC transporter permease [Luteibacter sp. UNCMF366Tsu5.1]SFW70730.1 iron complex transport system permease protein [Luteibacter sp. UNCMF366Tsu5.1]
MRESTLPRMTTFASALRLWLVMLFIAAIVVLGSLLLGGADSSVAASWQALRSADPTPMHTIVWELRLPRSIAAFGVGGLLAISGCLMQILVRNPLADPYTLGLSGGAAVGALGAMLAGAGALATAAGAASGALLACIAVFVLAHRDLLARARAAQREDSTDLILIGVMLAAGLGAIVSMMLVLAPDRNLRGMLFWMMGDLSGVAHGAWPVITLLVCVVLAAPLGRQLNLLMRGEESASALGVRPNVVKSAIFALASVATAVAVTTAGTVGFVGLVVPHALRRVVGNDQRVLLPACAIGGGIVVTIADTISRIVVDPIQLPVGAVMAIIGVPAFMVLLVRRR